MSGAHCVAVPVLRERTYGVFHVLTFHNLNYGTCHATPLIPFRIIPE